MGEPKRTPLPPAATMPETSISAPQNPVIQRFFEKLALQLKIYSKSSNFYTDCLIS
jgi:hypothetical protein